MLLKSFGHMQKYNIDYTKKSPFVDNISDEEESMQNRMIRNMYYDSSDSDDYGYGGYGRFCPNCGGYHM